MDQLVSKRIGCSVGILARNSAATLEQALESLSRFDDIIVCDGGSTDSTRRIARQHHARILEQDPAYLDSSGRIIDYAGVRNQTLDAAAHPWFLFIDSDEYLSEELVSAIDEAVAADARGAYFVYREYELDGERITCASTYPTKNMRFFHMDSVSRFIKPIHERIDVREDASVRDLPRTAPLIVPIRDTPAESRQKNRRYIELELGRIELLSAREWARRAFRRFLISGKLLLKMLKGLFFCKGTPLPVSHEMNRHWYHLALTYREFLLLFRHSTQERKGSNARNR